MNHKGHIYKNTTIVLRKYYLQVRDANLHYKRNHNQKKPWKIKMTRNQNILVQLMLLQFRKKKSKIWMMIFDEMRHVQQNYCIY